MQKSFCIKLIFGLCCKVKCKQHLRIFFNFCQHRKNNTRDPFMRNSHCIKRLPHFSTALSLKHFSQMTFIFLFFFCLALETKRKTKITKKSIYLRKHFLRIDDDFIFVVFLCCCWFNIYAKEHRKEICCIVWRFKLLWNWILQIRLQPQAGMESSKSASSCKWNELSLILTFQLWKRVSDLSTA